MYAQKHIQHARELHVYGINTSLACFRIASQSPSTVFTRLRQRNRLRLCRRTHTRASVSPRVQAAALVLAHDARHFAFTARAFRLFRHRRCSFTARARARIYSVSVHAPCPRYKSAYLHSVRTHATVARAWPVVARRRCLRVCAHRCVRRRCSRHTRCTARCRTGCTTRCHTRCTAR